MHANGYAMLTETANLSDATEVRDNISVEGAYQPTLERDVVVRRLRATSDPRLRSRFLKEVKALALLRHHGFIHVYDAGVKDNIPFAVFERLHGITAQHRLDLLADRQVHMELGEAVRIVESVARAVAYARRRGVRVHDVSPANITLTEDSRVVLTGLGEPLPDNPLMASPTMLAYAAPEQLFGAPAEGDTDVYALGVLLAQLLFGRLPFEGSQLGIIAQKQQLESLPALSDPGATLACPYPLAVLMHRATASDPRDRLASVEQFTEALLDAAGSRSSQSTRATSTQPRGQRAAYEAPEPIRPFANIHPFPTSGAPSTGRTVAESYVHLGAGAAFLDEPALLRREPKPVAQPAATPRDMHTLVVPPAPASDHAPATQATTPVMSPATTFEQPPAPVFEAAGDETPVYDPLMPGLDQPALALALPYTILVPMPEGAEQHQAPTRNIPQQNVLRPQYVLVLMMLFALAIGAAVMFG